MELNDSSPIASNRDAPAACSSCASDQLPLKTKLGYGAGGIADFLITTLPSNMAIPVFSRHLGMDTGLLGIALAIPKILAAASDSLVGTFSDNTRSKHGRRRPFIILGAVLSALLLPCIWTVPQQFGTPGMFLYICVLLTACTMLYSVFSVPYQALGYELTEDYDERTRVQAWKGCVSGIGFFMAPWFFWFCTRAVFPDMLAGVRWLSIVVGAVVVIGALLTISLCHERALPMRQQTIAIWPALALTTRNRAFMFLQGSILLLAVAISCGGAVGFYLLLDYVCGGDIRLFGLLQGVTGTVGNVMTYAGMGLGVWLSTRFGKRLTGTVGLLLVLAGGLAVAVFLAPRYSWLPWIPEKYHPWLTMVPGIIMNLGLQTCNLIFSSMMADVCDEDELTTGLRREGAYVAVAGVFSKLLGVVTVVIAGFLPHLAGYVDMTLRPTEPQLVAMKWVLVVFQCAATVAALAFLYFYPITRKRALLTRQALAERRASATQDD